MAKTFQHSKNRFCNEGEDLPAVLSAEWLLVIGPNEVTCSGSPGCTDCLEFVNVLLKSCPFIEVQWLNCSEAVQDNKNYSG